MICGLPIPCIFPDIDDYDDLVVFKIVSRFSNLI